MNIGNIPNSAVGLFLLFLLAAGGGIIAAIRVYQLVFRSGGLKVGSLFDLGARVDREYRARFPEGRLLLVRNMAAIIAATAWFAAMVCVVLFAR